MVGRFIANSSLPGMVRDGRGYSTSRPAPAPPSPGAGGMSRPRRGEDKARRGLLVVIVLDRGLASAAFATIVAGPGLQVVPPALYSPEGLE
jgi:hypothetical protein